MACSSCGTGGGCSTTGDSGCGKSGGCSSGGCNKLNSFDWLGNMEMETISMFNIVEIKFKGGRKEFFKNAAFLDLNTGDPVIVDVPNGHHLGHVSMQGELVRLQMKKKNVADDDNVKQIYRVANQRDLEKYEQSKNREAATMFRARQLIQETKLEMKLSDVEFQADNTKATFYYSADERVDFRELIKVLASEFKVRVEMKQISLRQEAGRLGGIGSCGRELCCSTWLTDFKNVNTSAARYQNLALNPAKLSGQCGRLKCCLNYELETYMDALKGIPEIESSLHTERGDAVLQKTDIFKKIMWFAYKDDYSTWAPLSVDRVNAILEMNKAGKKPATLDANEIEEKGASMEMKKEKEELSRFDDKFGSRKKKKKKKGPGNQNNNQDPQQNANPNPNPANNNPRPNNNNNQKPTNNNQGPQQNQQNRNNNNPNNQNKKPQGNNNNNSNRNQNNRNNNNRPNNNNNNPNNNRPNNNNVTPDKKDPIE